MYMQKEDGSFYEVPIPKTAYIGTQGWRDVRVDFVTNRAQPDLVVVEGYGTEQAYMRVYSGTVQQPFFDFSAPYFLKELPSAGRKEDKQAPLDIFLSGRKSGPHSHTHTLNMGIFCFTTVGFAAPGLEILNVNGDGHLDIYVTQADESSGYWCVLKP